LGVRLAFDLERAKVTGIKAQGLHLYAVGDVRHDLDGLAQVVPAPLAVDDGLL